MRPAALFMATLWMAGNALAQAGSYGHRPTDSPASLQQSLPHDRHDGLSVSADPYASPERAKKEFGKADPFPAGILPVEVFLQNETEQPIRINLSTIQLEVKPSGAGRQDIAGLTAAEVAKAITHPQGPEEPHARRFPVGIPTAGEDKKVEKLASMLRPVALDSDVVPPMGAIHGFLFFDVSHDMSIARSASLYMPDATVIPSNKALMFFEIPFGDTAPK